MRKPKEDRIQIQHLARFLDPQFLQSEAANNPRVFQEAFGISDQTLEVYYKAACSIQEKQQWRETRDAFIFLTFINPWVCSFWVGLGVAYQSLKEFESAISAYAMAEAIDSNHPIPLANSFQCLIALNQFESAEHCRLAAIKCCADKPEWEGLKAQLLEIHKVLTAI